MRPTSIRLLAIFARILSRTADLRHVSRPKIGLSSGASGFKNPADKTCGRMGSDFPIFTEISCAASTLEKVFLKRQPSVSLGMACRGQSEGDCEPARPKNETAVGSLHEAVGNFSENQQVPFG